MSRGRNASARGRSRSSGQMYLAVTIPQATMLNAMLAKKQSCDTMSVSSSGFRPLTALKTRCGLGLGRHATGGGGAGHLAARRRGLAGPSDQVLPPPDLGLGHEVRFRRERTTQFPVVAVQIEAEAEGSDHGLRELAKPVAERPPVARQRRIATSDRLEVLGGVTCHIEDVGRWCAQLEGATLVIVDVVAKAAQHVERVAAHASCVQEQPAWRRQYPDRSPEGPADGAGHVVCAEELRSR